MPKQFPKGGMRRTINCGCGRALIGHPNQLEGIIKIHAKKCEHAEGMLRSHRENPHDNAIAQPYQEDTRRGDIRTAIARNDNGASQELTRVVGGSRGWDEVSKKDLKERIKKAQKPKKPPTGKAKREAKRNGMKPNDFYMSREDMNEVAQLGDDLVADGYSPKYMGFWKGNLSPIIYQDKEVFDTIRDAGKDLAETMSRDEIVEQLDILNEKLYGANAPTMDAGYKSVDEVGDEYILWTTLYATNIYAFSWKTGICGENEGFCANFIKQGAKCEVIVLKEFY